MKNSILEFDLPEALEAVVTLYEELPDLQANEALQGLRRVITNFRIKPSDSGGGSSVWCDAYSRTDAVETRPPDVIERDKLILQLNALGFESQGVGTWWNPPLKGKPPTPTLDVLCIKESADYDLGITFQRGATKFSFWPKGWRKNGYVPAWEPIEITRHFRYRKWSDEQLFALISSVARMANDDRPAQSLLDLVQRVRIPESEPEPWAPAMKPLRRPAAPVQVDSGRRVLEEPTALELCASLSSDVAEEFVRRLGQAVTNFEIIGENGLDLSIRGDVIESLSVWDSRTADQKLRDIAIDSLRRRGLVAKIPDEVIAPPYGGLYVELFDPSIDYPLFCVSDWSVSCVALCPTSCRNRRFTFFFNEFPGGAAAAYSFLSLVADACLKGEQIEELLMLHNPRLGPLRDPVDDDPYAAAE